MFPSHPVWTGQTILRVFGCAMLFPCAGLMREQERAQFRKEDACVHRCLDRAEEPTHNAPDGQPLRVFFNVNRHGYASSRCFVVWARSSASYSAHKSSLARDVVSFTSSASSNVDISSSVDISAPMMHRA